LIIATNANPNINVRRFVAAPVCSVQILNTETSIHIKYSDPDALVQVGCSNRDPVNCVYYSVYKVFQCRAADNPCQGPRYALINGECCSLGEGCPADLVQQPAPEGAPEGAPEPANPLQALETRVTLLELRLNDQLDAISQLQEQNFILRQHVDALDAKANESAANPKEPIATSPPIQNSADLNNNGSNNNRNPDVTILNPTIPIPPFGSSDTADNSASIQNVKLKQQQTGITVLSVMIVLGVLGIICILIAVVLYKRRRARTLSLRE